MATDDKVSVILTSTNTNGDVKQKSFTYISPEATNGQLKAFAQAANSLTENTYNGSRKVTQVDLDTADPGQQKQTPTLTLSPTTLSLATIGQGQRAVSITYDGDGLIYLGYSITDGAREISPTFPYGSTSPYEMKISANLAYNPQPGTITIKTTETDNYKAAEATLTITA